MENTVKISRVISNSKHRKDELKLCDFKTKVELFDFSCMVPVEVDIVYTPFVRGNIKKIIQAFLGKTSSKQE